MDIINEIDGYLDPIDEDILNEITNKDVRKMLINLVIELKDMGVDLSKGQQKRLVLKMKKELGKIEWLKD